MSSIEEKMSKQVEAALTAMSKLNFDSFMPIFDQAWEEAIYELSKKELIDHFVQPSIGAAKLTEKVINDMQITAERLKHMRNFADQENLLTIERNGKLIKDLRNKIETLEAEKNILLGGGKGTESFTKEDIKPSFYCGNHMCVGNAKTVAQIDFFIKDSAQANAELYHQKNVNAEAIQKISKLQTELAKERRQHNLLKVQASTFNQPDCTKITNLKTFTKAVHENAKSKGFYNGIVELPTCLALIHSEVSEALEVLRKHDSTKHQLEDKVDVDDVLMAYEAGAVGVIEEYEVKIKNTFAAELADIVLRVFDLSEYVGINIEHHLVLKNAYNKSRPAKHGKNF